MSFIRIDRNAQGLDRIRRNWAKTASSGSGSSIAFANASIVSTSIGIRTNYAKDVALSTDFEIRLSTAARGSTNGTAFGVALFLNSTDPSTNPGANALFGQVLLNPSTGSTSSTGIYQGSTLLASTSGLVGHPELSNVLSLSTHGSTAWLLVNGNVSTSTTFTANSTGVYAGFFALSANTLRSYFTGWEVKIGGFQIIADAFPGTYNPDNIVITTHNSTYRGTVSTDGIGAEGKASVLYRAAIGDQLAVTSTGLDGNSLTNGQGEALLYRQSIYGSTINRSALSTVSSGITVEVDNVTIGINNSNQLYILPTGGFGTVTSVALSLPSTTFSTVGSPITSAGTFNVTFTAQGSTQVLVGPSSGAAAVPTWRTLSTSDISFGPQTSTTFFAGPASGAAATPGFRNISTRDVGLSAQGDLLTVDSTSALLRLPVGANNQFLVVNTSLNGKLQWVDLASSTVLGAVLPLSTSEPDHDGGAIYRTDLGDPRIRVRGNPEAFCRVVSTRGTVTQTSTTVLSTFYISTTFPANYFSTGMVDMKVAFTRLANANAIASLQLRTFSNGTSTIWQIPSAAVVTSGLPWHANIRINVNSSGSTSSSPLNFYVFNDSQTVGSGLTILGSSTWNVDMTNPITFVLIASTASTAAAVSTSSAYASILSYN